MDNANNVTRREFFKVSGALVISVALPGSIEFALSQTASGKPPLIPDEPSAATREQTHRGRRLNRVRTAPNSVPRKPVAGWGFGARAATSLTAGP